MGINAVHLGTSDPNPEKQRAIFGGGGGGQALYKQSAGPVSHSWMTGGVRPVQISARGRGQMIQTPSVTQTEYKKIQEKDR